MAKGFTITIQPKQYHEQKMTKEELDKHLQMLKSGASKTKNAKRYSRKTKHKLRDY